MNPIADYLRPLSRDEVLRALLSLAAAIGVTTTAWKTGDPPKAVLSIFAGFIASTWNAAVLPVLSAFFLDYAAGVMLRIASRVFWGVEPKGATYASGKLTVENRDVLPHTFSPDELAAKNGTTGKVYRNVTGGFLAAWSGSPLDPYPELELDFEAVELGTSSNALPNQIQADPAQGPAGVYFQPNASALLGQDEERDEDLKARIRASVGALSPAGPRAAYEFVALSTRVPGTPAGTEEGRKLLERLLVSREGDVAVNVNRARVVASSGAVSVWLASPSGAAAGTDVYLVNQAVQLLVVPAGITATVAPATEVPVARAVDIRIARESGLAESEAAEAIDGALARFFRELPIGGRKLAPGGPGYVLMRDLETSVRTLAHREILDARLASLKSEPPATEAEREALISEALRVASGIFYVAATGADAALTESEVATSAVSYSLTTVTQS